MSDIEIPLLRESVAFSARLFAAARGFGDPKYHFHRRVNWSHRYNKGFYIREAECFQVDPDAYLAGKSTMAPQLSDVYVLRLRPRQVAGVLLKVLAHWLFHLLGSFANRRVRARRVHTYRKCYVDDIELVFDPLEAGVVRAVYPFPINLRRQLRYLSYLRRKRFCFKLAGNPYVPLDVLHFLIKRNVKALMRLESRAQIRHAKQVHDLGIQSLQLSDEFDIGGLDFTRRLARFRVQIINSAHGVGKYLPVHAYQYFHTLTLKQQQYYRAVRDCNYSLRQLNDRPADETVGYAERRPTTGADINLVVLSQRFGGPSDVISDNEKTLVERLQTEFAHAWGVRLYYKPHPNRRQPAAPAGFQLLLNLNDVNDRDGTVFVSFFSTCQIDPAFKGRKILVRGHFIYPEIAFDDSEEITDLDGLVRLVTQLVDTRNAAHTRSRETVQLDS